MKQIFQSLESGETLISEIPSPSLKKGHLLIKSSYSLISTGTEKTLVNFGKSNIIEKVRDQPEKLNDVIQKFKRDGLITTYQAVKSKLEQPIPLGYCNVGIVIAIGKGVKGFNIGDKVVSNGPHAEIIAVPKNLCALIPNGVNEIEAVFTIPASIGLQGIRLLKPTFGETILVIGLGLIGNLTAQLLKNQGCRVIGFDIDQERCNRAKELGIQTIPLDLKDEPENWCLEFTNNIGVDGVIIAASTKSNDPITMASKVCRKRGRIILIGVTKLNINRDLFYEKEISFQVSCSYGPGRYDSSYEEDGIDYPIGYVRWTEKRNFEAILFSLQNKQINVEKMISKKFDINDAKSAYKSLLKDRKNYAILISYENQIELDTKNVILRKEFKAKQNNENISLAVIGSGNYASRFIIPFLSKENVFLKTLVATSGLRPYYFGKKFNFKYACTENSFVLKDQSINTVFIATRHNTHAKLIIEALKNNKNIFVEKPLCINKKELKEIEKTYKNISSNNAKQNIPNPILMIGFNRRFSPYIKEIKKVIDTYKAPKSFIYTCNAGYLPNNHWTRDEEIGGGRLIGEACHFLDLLIFLSGSKVQKIEILRSYKNILGKDNFSLNISFFDGSIGTIHYFANGNKGYPKEKLEIFFSEKIIFLENFRKLKSWGFKRPLKNFSISQKKGQKECIHEFINSLKNGQPSPINIEEIIEVHALLLNLNS